MQENDSFISWLITVGMILYRKEMGDREEGQ